MRHVFASLLFLAACGGSVAPIPDPTGSGSGSGGSASAQQQQPPGGSSTTVVGSASAPASAPPGPWGVWRLVSLDGPPGVPASEPAPPMQLELRADGTAYRARCTDAQQERCPGAFTYDCLAGTVAWDGSEWRVDIPDIRVGGVPEQGQIVSEPGGGILVRYIYPTYSGGHFIRVDDGAGSCAP